MNSDKKSMVRLEGFPVDPTQSKSIFAGFHIKDRELTSKHVVYTYNSLKDVKNHSDHLHKMLAIYSSHKALLRLFCPLCIHFPRPIPRFLFIRHHLKNKQWSLKCIL